MTKEIKPAFLFIGDMIALFNRSRSWVLSKNRKNDGFPQAVLVGGCLGWRTEEVEQYIATRIPPKPMGLDATNLRAYASVKGIQHTHPRNGGA